MAGGIGLPFKGRPYDGLTNALKGIMWGGGTSLPSKLIRITCELSSKDVSVSCEIGSPKSVAVLCAIENV